MISDPLKRTLPVVFLILFTAFSRSQVIPGEPNMVIFSREKKSFALAADGRSTPLLIGSDDYPGVTRAFKDLQSDIGKVTSSRVASRRVSPLSLRLPASMNSLLHLK